MKKELLRRTLTKAQTKYEVIKKNVTQQSSYNLDLTVEKELLVFFLA